MATVLNRRSSQGGSTPRMKSGHRYPSSQSTRQSSTPSAATAPTVPSSMPLAQMGFEGSRHLEPERLPSGRRERARTVRVLDLNQATIDSIKQIAESLKRLDLSSLKLEKLNEDLMECLVGLERLDIGFNQLTDSAIPQCFGKLENLVELSAHYNKLTTVPKVLKKLKNVSRLKLGHNELDTIEGIERLKKLQVLVIENNKIEAIPRDIYQNLKRLEMWHLSHNQLKELHSDVRLLRYLRDLDVSGNSLSTLPPELFLLPRLEVLNASSNQISRLPTVNIKGNNRPHLAMVDLSDNQLVKFPEHLLLIAEKLDLSKNKIKVIPGNLIKKLDWATGQELNVSDNPLNNPPLDICECGLKSIMQYFQEAKTDMKVYQGLKVLVLGSPSCGKTSLVQTLVDQQPRLTTKEEATSGIDIYEVTLEVEGTAEEMAEPTPDLPPQEEEPQTPKKPARKKKREKSKSDRSSVDSEEGTKSRAASQRKKKSKDDDIVTPTPTPVSSSMPPVEMAEISEELPPVTETPAPENKSLQLSIWDFSGNPHYLYSHYMFLQQPSLTWLVFDMSTYEDEKFGEMIGCWIEYIIAKSNKMVAMIIGTHSDKIRPKKAAEICESIHERITKHINDHKDSIEKEIKKITNRSQIPSALTDQLKRYIELLKFETTIHPKVLPVSSKDLSGIEELQEATKTMALNKEVYPNVLKAIPSLWTNVEFYIEDKGYGMQSAQRTDSQEDDKNDKTKVTAKKEGKKKRKKEPKEEEPHPFKDVPIMSFSDYSEEISKKFGMKHLITQITHYLHDTGKILWFSDHPTLCEYIFLRPSWLADILKSLFRHDWSESDYTLEEAFKASNMNPHKVEKLKRELMEEGVADKDILKCLWSHLIPTDMNRPILEVIAMLLDHFELAYPMARPGSRDTTRSMISERSESSSTIRSMRHDRDRSNNNERDDSTSRLNRTESQVSHSTTHSKKEKAEAPKVSRILLPWLRTTRQPKNFKEEYEQFLPNPSLAAVFRFSKYTPPGFFETLTVRAMNQKHDLSMLHHWKGGLYARFIPQALRFYLLRIQHEDASTCMRVEVRSEQIMASGEEEKYGEMLWNLMLPFLKDVEDLIAKFAGARVERHMECPECHALAFLGEWVTPKEKLQNIPGTKECDVCHKEVNTVFLIQPKEKRKVEEFLMQKIKNKGDEGTTDDAAVEGTQNTISEEPEIALEESKSETVGDGNGPTEGRVRRQSESADTPDDQQKERRKSTTLKKRKSIVPKEEAVA